MCGVAQRAAADELTRRHLTRQTRNGDSRGGQSGDTRAARCGTVIQAEPAEQSRAAEGDGCQNSGTDARQGRPGRPEPLWLRRLMGRQDSQYRLVERLIGRQRLPAGFAAAQMILYHPPFGRAEFVVEQRREERVDLLAVHRILSVGLSTTAERRASARRLNNWRAPCRYSRTTSRERPSISPACT